MSVDWIATGDPSLDPTTPAPADTGAATGPQTDPCGSLAGDPVSYQHCQDALAAKAAGAPPPAPLGVSWWDQFIAGLPQAPTSSQQFWRGLGSALPGGLTGITLAGTGVVILAVVAAFVVLSVWANPPAHRVP